MQNRSVWTLAQAARLLHEPQHRLIYLCEKLVVVPDFADASGRGSSRRFSARNLLEFAIALKLRTLGLPVGMIAAIVYTLRAFEQKVAAEMPEFDLATALRRPSGIDLRAIVADGERLFFLLKRKGEGGRLLGGIELNGAMSRKASTLVSQLKAVPRTITGGDSAGFNGPEGSKYVRLDINIGQIARDLELEV